MANIPPTMLKTKLLSLPESNDARNVLRVTTSRASRGPERTMTIRVTILARPSFAPGTGRGAGIMLSTAWRIRAKATRRASLVIR